MWVPFGLTAAGIAEGVLLAAESPTSDPIVFFLSQGVLGVVVVMLWREYQAEKRKNEAMVTKLIDDFVPLLTRGTEAMERLAEAQSKRGGRQT